MVPSFSAFLWGLILGQPEFFFFRLGLWSKIDTSSRYIFSDIIRLRINPQVSSFHISYRG